MLSNKLLIRCYKYKGVYLMKEEFKFYCLRIQFKVTVNLGQYKLIVLKKNSKTIWITENDLQEKCKVRCEDGDFTCRLKYFCKKSMKQRERNGRNCS